MALNLEIGENIPESFDRIAKDLLLGYVLQVNEIELELTEIEFYFFRDTDHKEMYTHEHDREEGMWRMHNQGLDITFEACDEKVQDGGILIRGIKYKGDEGKYQYTNGPRNVLFEIFRAMNGVEERNIIQLKQKQLPSNEIIRTFRHLPNKIEHKEFHELHYRYLIELDLLDIPKAIKEQIRNNYSKVI